MEMQSSPVEFHTLLDVVFFVFFSIFLKSLFSVEYILELISGVELPVFQRMKQMNV